ncbi:MAG TPA: hypothetical protein VGP07_00130 [Polyangia bacterium]|jgi:hypothetical protein
MSRLRSVAFAFLALALLHPSAHAAPTPPPTPEADVAPLEPAPAPPVLELDPDDLGEPEPAPASTRPLAIGEQLTLPPLAPAPPSRFSLIWGGAVDFGFFIPRGTGVGWIQDEGPNRAFPADANRYAWVFLGDIYSTAVNARGEPADLGNPPGVDRTDSIASNGAAGFAVNEVNLIGTAGLGDNVVGTFSTNFVPRSGFAFARGDSIEVDLAQIEWLPTTSQKTSIYVGKMESVVGIEYRDRKAVARFGVTPSLISRYTTGTPLGVKVIHKMGDELQLVVAGALTNGSSVVEPFHFSDEIDSNNGKTASGRISGRLHGAFELEIGASGSYGAQDHALDDRHPLWFGGFDLLAHYGRVDIKAQWLTGRGKGETDRLYNEDHRPYGLHLSQGAYLEADVMVTPWLGFIGRGEFRDARVWLGDPTSPEGADRLYITKSWRATGGVRIVFSSRTVLKAEYLRNGEYGGVPNIDNDIFTSSFVWSF